MTTILVWLGSGFAFAVGVCFGAWLARLAWQQPSPVVTAAETALLERNEIGRKQVAALERIADAMKGPTHD